MADDQKEGVANFLDRIGDSIDNIDNVPDEPEESSEEKEKTPDPQLDDLGESTKKDKVISDDPLDNLEPEENIETSSTQEEPVSSEPEATEDTGDLLDTFDEADRAKLQEYLDKKITEELELSASAGGAFKRLRNENRDLNQTIKNLESRTAEPEALKAATEKISELEAQIKTNEQANSVLRLEDTQAYKDAVIKPQQEILSRSDAIAERYGVNRDELANLMGISDRRALSDGINKLMGDDVADADKFELYELSRHTEATFAKKKQLVDNADAALREAEDLAEKERERSALKARQGREEAAKATVDRLSSKAKFILDTVGDDAVQEVVDDIAERDIDALSEQDRAFARLSAKAVVPLARKILTLERELEEVNDELSARRKASPGGSGKSGGSVSEEAEDKETTPGNFAERLSSRIEQAIGG